MRTLAATMAVVGLAALLSAGAAQGTHEHPQSASSITASIVPIFKQCGTGPNPVNGSHSPPLAVGSCSPPHSQGVHDAHLGPETIGTVEYVKLANDLSVQLSLSDIRSTSGADFDPARPSLDDLALTARIRYTDHFSCQPAPCFGNYNLPATATDIDFGQFYVNCVPVGDPATPPGSNCNLTTTANTYYGTPIISTGVETVIQFFRTRIYDNTTGNLFAQQGIFVP